MLRAYRLVYDLSEHAPPQLWEYEQPFVDNLILSAKTFGRRIVGWWFESWAALDRDNRRIWETYYRSHPSNDHIPGWQAYLEQHRQIIVEVQEVAKETGWRGVKSFNISSANDCDKNKSLVNFLFVA